MSRRVISDQQFAEMATDGASRHLETKEQGPRGYYVSRDPNVPMSEGGGVETVAGAPTRAEIAGHRSSALPAMHYTEPGKRKDVFQGVWSESKEKGPTYLDVSDRTPSYSEALNKGAMGSQRAIARVTGKKDKEGKPVVDIIPTGTENETGRVVPTESALMQSKLQGKKEMQAKQRRRMSKAEKGAALESMDKDVQSVKRALG